jgi:carbon starvation protein
MDGVDFMPTNKNILFGYHFKSIAAAGPIVGAIVATTLWGWLPAMIWLIGGVAFMGWVRATARPLCCRCVMKAIAFPPLRTV